MYGQPSWWTAPDDDAPLTLQPIHCATKWTEANPTPVKSERFSPAPTDSTKRHSSTPVKTTGTTPREKTSSVKDSKLTSRLIKKITPSSKKISSGSNKSSTSSSAASSASNSSSDLLKGSIVRGTPKRETYIKKTTSSSRPRSAEVISSSSPSTALQKPASKFDRKSPQRQTYNKKEPTLPKKTPEVSSTSKPEKKPRETVAELRQRMQQTKKAAANQEGESDIQIFVSSKPPPAEEAVADDDSNVVSSSIVSFNDSESQQSSQRRKQWEVNEVKHIYINYLAKILILMKNLSLSFDMILCCSYNQLIL